MNGGLPILAEIANHRQEKQIKPNRISGYLKILYLHSSHKAVFLGTVPWPKKCCKYLQIICRREFKKRRPHSKIKYSIRGLLIFTSFKGSKV